MLVRIKRFGFSSFRLLYILNDNTSIAVWVGIIVLAGLVPILFSTGTDVVKRIVAPMVGGVVTSTILELIIYPAIFLLRKKRRL